MRLRYQVGSRRAELRLSLVARAESHHPFCGLAPPSDTGMLQLWANLQCLEVVGPWSVKLLEAGWSSLGAHAVLVGLWCPAKPRALCPD